MMRLRMNFNFLKYKSGGLNWCSISGTSLYIIASRGFSELGSSSVTTDISKLAEMEGVKVEASVKLKQEEPIAVAAPTGQFKLVKPALSTTIKSAVTYRSNIVAHNIFNLRKSMFRIYNEMNSKRFDFFSFDSYRVSFVRLVESGINNIALAFNFSRLHHYNSSTIMKFNAFFRRLKCDYQGFLDSDRCLNNYTILVTSFKSLGVNISHCCSKAVIAIWTFGIQNVAIRRIFSKNRSLNLSVKRANVVDVGQDSKTVTYINNILCTSSSVKVVDLELDFDRLLILSDTSGTALSENCDVLLNSFDIAIFHKESTSERVAVFNSRGVGSYLGYTVSEPMLGKSSLVIGKKEKFLLMVMSVYGETIANNSTLMSSGLKSFLSSTIKANGLSFELCNIDFSLTMSYNQCSVEQLECLPFTIACLQNYGNDGLSSSDIVSSILFAGIDVSKEFKGIEVFNAYPSVEDKDTGIACNIENHFDYSTSMSNIPNLTIDSTIRTPVTGGSVMYLMYSYLGRFTPVLFTPAVIEKKILFEGKHSIDLYVSDSFDWGELFFHDDLVSILSDRTLPFIDADGVMDDKYPRLMYNVNINEQSFKKL